jgi:hypothetical protein
MSGRDRSRRTASRCSSVWPLGRRRELQPELSTLSRTVVGQQSERAGLHVGGTDGAAGAVQRPQLPSADGLPRRHAGDGYADRQPGSADRRVGQVRQRRRRLPELHDPSKPQDHAPVTITPHDYLSDGTAAGGTFTPSTVTASAGHNAIANFTYCTTVGTASSLNSRVNCLLSMTHLLFRKAPILGVFGTGCSSDIIHSSRFQNSNHIAAPETT